MGPEQQALLQSLGPALEGSHPLMLLELVSSAATTLDPGRGGPPGEAGSAPMSFEQLVESFTEISLPQTSAVLAVVAATTEDEVLRSRLRKILVARQHALPGWLRNLDLDPHEVAEMTDTLGDGDDLLIGVRASADHEFTLLVYIDHNVGTIVKDAFAIPQPLETVLAGLRTDVAGPDQDIHPYDAADARARIEDAVAKSRMTHPPFESDTWPACRPLLEWVLHKLPAGGRGHQRPEWSQADLGALSDDFVSSDLGAGWDDPAARSLLGSLFRFAAEYGSGDPLRWSPVVVEVVLDDWAPRKLFADVENLSRVPDLLRAFIRYCHHRRGVRHELTADTVRAVDRYDAGYQDAIRAPRDYGLLAVLDHVSALGRPSALMLDDDLEMSFEEYMLQSLTRPVGGMGQLDRLDSRPLDDEPFDWGPVPTDIHERVAEVLTLCDGFCDDQLDVEFRTACRRLLSDVAAGDPAIFRRKGAADRAAAALCWVIGKANGLVGYHGRMQTQEMLGWFGVDGSVSDRAGVMLRAVDVDPSEQFGIVDLGSPQYLTAARRAEIIARRDHHRAAMAD